MKLNFCFLPELLGAVEKRTLPETPRLINIDVESVNARYSGGSNDTLFHETNRKGACKIVNEFLMYHANVNPENKEGCSRGMELLKFDIIGVDRNNLFETGSKGEMRGFD